MASPRLSHRSATLPVREGGVARLVVVADTHSEPHPATAERLAGLRPDAILHAGDVGHLGVLDALARHGPLFAVRGNIDGMTPSLPDALTLDLVDGERRVFRLLLMHIAVYGPKIRADAARLARAEGASLLVCGHSHVPFITRQRELTVFNPGSIGPRRFPLPIVFGTIDVTPERVSLAHIDCETGLPWSPPLRPSRARVFRGQGAPPGVPSHVGVGRRRARDGGRGSPTSAPEGGGSAAVEARRGREHGAC